MSAPEVEVVTSHDSGWDDHLEAVADDIYHLAGYHRFAEETGGGKAFLAVIRESRGRRGLLWPYLLRPVADVSELADAEAFDVDSVYGYPGPLAWGCRPDEPFVHRAAGALVAAWRSQGALTAFTRFHPLLGNALWGANLPAEGPGESDPILQLGETVGVDLRQDDSTAVAAYSKTLRQDIASARRAGMTTRLDEDWATLDVFAELYRETMIRTGAAVTYFFSSDEFSRLKTALGTELHLFVTELDGRTAAAGLFTEHRRIVQAHLVGTDDEFRAWSPLKLLLDDVRRWASERGNAVLHLGGGRGGRDDSLLAFKRRFSPRRYPFSVGRWVLDPAAYAALTSARAARAKAEGRVAAEPSFFPAYRAPLQSQEGISGTSHAAMLKLVPSRGSEPILREARAHNSMTNGAVPFNVLLLSAGRRVSLLRSFRDSLKSLSLAGHVFAADTSPLSAAFQDSDNGFLVPPCSDPDFVPALLRICSARDVGLVVPTIDPELPVLAANREEFARVGTVLAVSTPEVIAVGSDKAETHRFFVAAKIPTVRQAGPSAVRRTPENWQFPLVVKPRRGSGAVSVSLVANPGDLPPYANDSDYIVQELASGREYTVDFLASSGGKMLCAVPRQRVEVRAGESSKGRTERNEAIIEISSRICDALPGPYGALTVQMFLDDLTGSLKVIELNPRFGGGYPLAWRAGARFPQWIIEEILGLPTSVDSSGWEDGLVMLRYDEAVFLRSDGRA
jgi:carbamoyl-phosphate synthase large subunit